MRDRPILAAALAVSALLPAPALAQTCDRPATPVTTLYLPNVTKTLGGPDGWNTPFIVQNVSRTVSASLRIEFYRFTDGSLVTARDVCVLKPGASHADIPNTDADLPNDTQFSVVVKSYMADAVAVVNEHRMTGATPEIRQLRAEAASYIGTSQGATSVFLPNVTKRFFGYDTPFIIQNLGTVTATATASFVSFDGTHTASIARTIAPGRSQSIDPDAEPSLRDGTQYAVTVAASQPLAVVVNTHNPAPPGGYPFTYATNGIAGGSSPVLGPYVVKNVRGVGKGVSTIVVQNVGSSPTVASIVFYPLGRYAPVIFNGPMLAAGRSWSFDPRYVDGDTSKGVCGATVTAGCLADGEYSFRAVADNDAIAAVVNTIGDTSAAGYGGILNGGSRAFLPNVTRTLGGASGWTTQIAVQGNTASRATVSWYRLSDGALVLTQTVTLGTGVAQLIDPRTVPGLTDDTQYSVVVEGVDGTVGAIAMELSFQGGDGAMIYEGAVR